MASIIDRILNRNKAIVKVVECPTCHAPGVRVGEIVPIHNKGAGCSPDTKAIMVEVRVKIAPDGSMLRRYR